VDIAPLLLKRCAGIDITNKNGTTSLNPAGLEGM
jgi:hypothetical protein